MTDVLLTLLELPINGTSGERRSRLRAALNLPEPGLFADDYDAEPVRDLEISAMA